MAEENKELLENSIPLSDDAKKDIKQAWEDNLNESRDAIRAEYATKFEHDKNQLIESVDKMVQDLIKEEVKKIHLESCKHIKAFADFSTSKLFEEVEKLRTQQRANAESFKQMKSYVAEQVLKNKKTSAEHVKAFETFAVESLAREVAESNYARKDLHESINVMKDFVVESLRKEVKETQFERKELQESRVKIVTEGKRKIEDARKRFVESATKATQLFVSQQLSKELTALKQDINEARKFKFAKELFESFSYAYRSKFFNESKELKRMHSNLKQRNEQVADKMKVLESKESNLKKAETLLREEKNRIVKERMLSESLRHLPRDKQNTMRHLMENVSVENLDTEIKKFLPMVLRESEKLQPKTVIKESQSFDKKQLREISGDTKVVKNEALNGVSTEFDDIINMTNKLTCK